MVFGPTISSYCQPRREGSCFPCFMDGERGRRRSRIPLKVTGPVPFLPVMKQNLLAWVSGGAQVVPPPCPSPSDKAAQFASGQTHPWGQGCGRALGGGRGRTARAARAGPAGPRGTQRSPLPLKEKLSVAPPQSTWGSSSGGDALQWGRIRSEAGRSGCVQCGHQGCCFLVGAGAQGWSSSARLS